MTKVSILLTSYNHEKYVKKSIESILNQTYTDFELIIVDDCSTDNSKAIINEYKDKRIKKIFHKKNIGYCMNEELVNSFEGEYFAIAHSDDIWKKDKLEKQVKYLENHKDVAACFTWVQLIGEDDQELSKVASKMYVDFNVENKNRFEWLNHFFYNGNRLCHPSILMRKAVQINEHLFVKGLGALPDFYRWVKLCLKHEIYIYPEKLTCFRIREKAANTSGRNKTNIIRGSFDRLPIFKLYQNIPKKEFLKVFPEAKKYMINNHINISFALARLCIDSSTFPPFKLSGLLLLFDILQDNKQALEIEKLYNYTIKDFKKETGENDIFNIIDENMFIYSSLYFNEGKDYSEDNKISEPIYITNGSNFTFYISNINKDIKSIRFDPDEGKFRCFKDLEIFINNEKVPYKAPNAVENNGWFYFFDLDPMFFADINKKVKSILITGKTKIINSSELYQYMQTTKENKIKKLFSNIKRRIKK